MSTRILLADDHTLLRQGLRRILEHQRDMTIVAEAGSGDALSKRVYASYRQFLPVIIDWSDIAEGAVLSSRRLA